MEQIKAYWFDTVSNLVGQLVELQTKLAAATAKITELEDSKAGPAPLDNSPTKP